MSDSLLPLPSLFWKDLTVDQCFSLPYRFREALSKNPEFYGLVPGIPVGPKDIFNIAISRAWRNNTPGVGEGTVKKMDQWLVKNFPNLLFSR
jgi:hypothetical protein